MPYLSSHCENRKHLAKGESGQEPCYELYEAPVNFSTCAFVPSAHTTLRRRKQSLSYLLYLHERATVLL